MSYSIQFKKSALKVLCKLSDDISRQIAKDVDALATNPRPTGCKKLKGADTLYRIRSGNYRVVYQIYDTVLLILVVHIGDRKDIYRNL